MDNKRGAGSFLSEEQLTPLDMKEEEGVNREVGPPNIFFQDRTRLLQELEKLTEEQLVQRIKQVEEWNYRLACSESLELKRGVELGILLDKQ